MDYYVRQSAELDLAFLESRVDDLLRSYYDEKIAENRKALAKRIYALKAQIGRKRELICQLNSL